MNYLKGISNVKIGNKYYLKHDFVIDCDNCEHYGLYLGKDTKNGFVPSLALLERIKMRKVVVDKKTEWLFVCGRDILKKHGLNKNEEALIVSESGEVLGLGRYDGKIIKNLFDIGKYLREDKKDL